MITNAEALEAAGTEPANLSACRTKLFPIAIGKGHGAEGVDQDLHFGPAAAGPDQRVAKRVRHRTGIEHVHLQPNRALRDHDGGKHLSQCLAAGLQPVKISLISGINDGKFHNDCGLIAPLPPAGRSIPESCDPSFGSSFLTQR